MRLNDHLDHFECMTSKSRPIVPVNLIAFWFMVASAWQALAVDPIVSNVQAKQRQGSRMVDITYDLADPDSPTLTVYLKVSPDGGKSWKGPVELVTGDVGQHIGPGILKRLVWDAGKEIGLNKYWSNLRYRVGASDEWLPPNGMVLIPAGPFQMGDGDTFRLMHMVTLSAFAMDKWEVPIELWESVLAWGNAHGYDLVARGSYGAMHPVRGVNWFNAVKWCNARSEKEGKVPAYYLDGAMSQVYRTGEDVPAGVKWDVGYRLPTEAEFEKAARGGVAGKLYPWGTDEISPDLVNYNESKKRGTMPVGSYGANGYGLYDMAGNVVEWCWDWFGEYAHEPQTDPRGPISGERHLWRRVIRGGAWDFNFFFCGVAYRGVDSPNIRYSDYGFRCVLPGGQP